MKLVPSYASNLKRLTKQWKTVVARCSQIKISLENAVEMESDNSEQWTCDDWAAKNPVVGSFSIVKKNELADHQQMG
jgi:hypothetical protein